jgi:hypothetical protein
MARTGTPFLVRLGNLHSERSWPPTRPLGGAPAPCRYQVRTGGGPVLPAPLYSCRQAAPDSPRVRRWHTVTSPCLSSWRWVSAPVLREGPGITGTRCRQGSGLFFVRPAQAPCLHSLHHHMTDDQTTKDGRSHGSGIRSTKSEIKEVEARDHGGDLAQGDLHRPQTHTD